MTMNSLITHMWTTIKDNIIDTSTGAVNVFTDDTIKFNKFNYESKKQQNNHTS